MTSLKTQIVPVTEDLVIGFYGSIPPKTLHAVAAVRDGETLGVAGIFSIGMAWMMFADMKPEILQDKRAMVLALRAIRKLIENTKLPVYAKAAEVEGAETLIQHAGAEIWHGWVQ